MTPSTRVSQPALLDCSDPIGRLMTGVVLGSILAVNIGADPASDPGRLRSGERDPERAAA
jgi:hypothetical protein